MRQPLSAHHNWGSGSTTPTGEGEGTPEPSPGGTDVPGAWPTLGPIERRLDENEDEGSVVELMAERIAHGRRASPGPSRTDRPRPLKRHETA
jgi:serine/threonine-protein phosphatase 2B catalytic subunit